MAVLDNNAPCGPYDARLGQVMRDIHSAAIPYNPLTTNSNTVAREALERARLNPGRPPVWAQGGTPVYLDLSAIHEALFADYVRLHDSHGLRQGLLSYRAISPLFSADRGSRSHA